MRKEEAYIIRESPEISQGEAPGWTHHFFKAFPALQHRNFQLYFVGQLISLIGTWLQTVAQGYLVYEITNSAFWVGLIAALQMLPVLMFALFGGVLIDRFRKRDIIYITQVGQMLLAFILGALTLLHIVDKYQIAVLSFLLGIFTAIDMPARQTFMSYMVADEHMSSGISLSGGVYNAARAIGPAFAGLLISWVGMGGAFILNGLSFIAVIIALYMMKVTEHIHNDHPHPIEAIKQGLKYSFSHAIISPLMWLAAIMSIFGWSYITEMPVIAKDIFHVGADGLGYLQSAAGAGAVIGAVMVSAYAGKVPARRFIFWGMYLFVVSLFLFAFTHTMLWGSVTLFFAGYGLILSFSMLNSMVQKLSDESIRGRVLSIYTLMFLGMAPFGNLLIGFLAEKTGVMNALKINAVIMLIATLLFHITKKKLREI